MNPEKIILIVIDTLRAGNLGCYGYERDTSPNLDAFAKEAVFFRNAFSAAPHTIPSIGSILTSKYPSNHSVGFNQTVNVETGKLNTNVDITMAEVLNGVLGFETAAFVSAAVLRKETNFNSGFGVYEDSTGSNPYGRRDGMETNQMVFKWLGKNTRPDRFFMFIHYFDVHGPYVLPEGRPHFRPEEYGDEQSIEVEESNYPALGKIPYYQTLGLANNGNRIKDPRVYKSGYDSCIRYCDYLIGNLFSRLKYQNIYDDSLIIVTSDHGEAMGENNIWFYHGLTVTPEQISVPLMIKPHKQWAVRPHQISIPVSNMDIMPTVLSLCSHDYRELTLDGFSLKGLIEDKEDGGLQKRRIMAENERQTAAIDQSLVMELKSKETPSSRYYPFIPGLVDSLNGRKYRCDTGCEYEMALPFDQYQRYRMAADIVNRYRGRMEKFRILEVGAGNEENLKKFLPRDEIVFLDKDYPETAGQRGNHISGDIARLDLEDNYDFVVSIDCYEHIPPAQRGLYLKKLFAAAKKAVIIGAPFDTPGVKEAERLANELHRLTRGKDYRWLAEHIQNGLPSLEYTLQAAAGAGLKTSVVPNGYLHRWFGMITVGLRSEGIPEFQAIMRELWEFYNINFYCQDNTTPAYRHFVIIHKDNGIEMPGFSCLLSKAAGAGEDFEFKSGLLKQYFEKMENLFHLFKSGGIGSFSGPVNEAAPAGADLSEICKAEGIASIVKDITVGNLESIIREKNLRLRNYEKEIETLQLDLKRMASQIEDINSERGDLSARIGSLESDLLGKNDLVTHAEAKAREKEEALNHIHNSNGWKILLAYYGIRDRILPADSKRRIVAKLFFNSVGKPGVLFRKLNRHNLEKFFHYLGSNDPSVLDNRIERHFKSSGKRPEMELFRGRPSARIIFPEYERPLVSIIIPVHNQWEFTHSCLDSISKNAGDVPYEVILADDASRDDTLRVSDFAEHIKIIRNEQNLGFLKNCNNASGYARGKYLLFLNNDTIAQKEWLKHMAELLERDAQTGIVGSKLVFPDGRLQEAGGIIWSDASGWNYGRYDDPGKPEYNYVKAADYVSGASLMIRKALWDEIGGFDENYAPAYCEDSDLAFEVRRRGYKVMYQPKSVVVHFEGVSNGTEQGGGIKRYQALNMNKLREKWKDVLDREHLANSSEVFWARDRSRDKRTLLVIDHYVPHFDRDAGSKTSFHYLKLFVEMGLNVKFLSDNFFRHEPYTTELEQLGIEVLVGRWYASNWKKWIKLNSKFIDCVYLNRPHISIKYIDFIKKNTQARILYYGHDLHSLREQRRYEVEKRQDILKLAKEWEQMEFQIFSKADVIYFPSAAEIEAIKNRLPNLNAKAIPAYVYEGFETGARQVAETRDIIFVGNFVHMPNMDAAIWFSREIFPLVLKQLPDVKFYIIGAEPPARIRQLASGNIIVTGFVTDGRLREFYLKSRLAVAPLRYGSGVKGKIIEALYYGVPVVTTSMGAEGIEDAKGILRISDDAAGFARSVASLYSDDDELLRMSRESALFAKNNFSKEKALEAIGQDLGAVR